MPPRRSSRSTRASVEPAQPESLPAKRKRGQTTELTADDPETSQKPPSKARRPSTRSGSAPASRSRASARGKTSLPEVVESQAEEEPATKRSRPSNEGVRNTPPPHEEPKNGQNSDDDIPDFNPKPSPRKQRESTREPVVEEEEEMSLFEPPPMPPPPSTAPPPPEEPSGPKSRLMIHKIALVNFKSYAGRQIIGPFHKVCISQVPPNLSKYNSL